MSKKVSDTKEYNLFWWVDERNSKILINLPKLFQKNLDTDSNRIFANFKRTTVHDYIEKGYSPNTLMGEVAQAYDDYQVLKAMFKI